MKTIVLIIWDTYEHGLIYFQEWLKINFKYSIIVQIH